MKKAAQFALILALWLATLVVAYRQGATGAREKSAAGSMPAVTSGPDASRPRPPSPPPEDFDRPPEDPPGRRGQGSSPDELDAAEDQALAVIERAVGHDSGEAGAVDYLVMKPVRSRNPVERIRNLSTLLDRLNASNIVKAVAALEGIRRDPRTFEISRLLWFRWGQLDGAAAADYLSGQTNSEWAARAHASSILSGWASVNPDRALQWAKDNFEGEDNPYLVGVVQGMADRDPYRAFGIAKTLPYGANRGSAVDVVIDELLQQNPSAVPVWAAGLETGVLKNGVVSRVAARMAAADPEGAAQWVRGLGDAAAQPEATMQVVYQWSARDPAKAAAWSAEVADESLRAKALAASVSAWAGQDFDAAGRWLERQPEEPEYDGARQQMAQFLRYRDPKAALAWAASIRDETARFRATDGIFRDWMRRDPEGAAAYMRTPK